MARTPEEILEEARKLVGTETPLRRAPYPVEYDPIRRTCHMVSDRNPLFLDPEYAKKTKYGAVISPPAMVNYFSGRGAWPHSMMESMISVPTAGDRAINLTVETEWFKPVKVGDWLSEKHRLADVYIKAIRLDPKAFWVVQERIISNQDGEVVCIERNTSLRHRTPEQIAEAGG
ncbi:MAG: MaoC family dehydratase N-terminal domain-containing protein [Chloroflexi bacterium]|nr:MaoC family dehydratase N-terminal domain-containing protein [Chloroflexota bacterium]